MTSNLDKLKSIVHNYRENIEPYLTQNHSDRYALVHKKELIHIFSNSQDATVFAASQQYNEGEYCIQEIGAVIAEFGFIGHMISRKNQCS